MGRTIPTATQLLDQEAARWTQFRRALRKEDREVFDWLFERARHHTAAAAYLSRRTPFDSIVIAMLIEVAKLLRAPQTLRPPEDRVLRALPPGPPR